MWTIVTLVLAVFLFGFCIGQKDGERRATDFYEDELICMEDELDYYITLALSEYSPIENDVSTGGDALPEELKALSF